MGDRRNEEGCVSPLFTFICPAYICVSRGAGEQQEEVIRCSLLFGSWAWWALSAVVDWRPGLKAGAGSGWERRAGAAAVLTALSPLPAAAARLLRVTAGLSPLGRCTPAGGALLATAAAFLKRGEEPLGRPAQSAPFRTGHYGRAAAAGQDGVPAASPRCRACGGCLPAPCSYLALAAGAQEFPVMLPGRRARHCAPAGRGGRGRSLAPSGRSHARCAAAAAPRALPGAGGRRRSRR